MRPKAPSFLNLVSSEVDYEQSRQPVPQHSAFCACDLCDTTPNPGAPTTPAPACVEGDNPGACDCGACLFARMPAASVGYVLTPLARAALDNGVPPDSVRSYLARLPERIPLFDEDTQEALDAALERASEAPAPASSRVWWQGVLDKLSRSLALLLVVLACLTATGCGANPCDPDGDNDGKMCLDRIKSEITVSPDFTPEQFEGILGAGKAWHDVTGGRVDLSFVVSGDDPLIAPDPKRGAVFGWEEHGKLFIWQGVPPELWQSVAEHELGHYFGMGHSDARPTDLMYIQAHYGAQITSADLEHFYRLWARAL